MARSLLFVLCANCAVLIAGCQRDDGPARYAVSGSVTHGGQPVPFGQIVFEPDAAQGNSGPAGFAVIRHGRFNTASDGKGIVGGPHVARISGYRSDPQGAQDAELAKLVLFENHAVAHEFPRAAAQVDFDVPGG